MTKSGQPYDLPTRIRQAGLRSTKQRVAALESLEQLPHATADELLHEVRLTLPTITIQSI